MPRNRTLIMLSCEIKHKQTDENIHEHYRKLKKESAHYLDNVSCKYLISKVYTFFEITIVKNNVPTFVLWMIQKPNRYNISSDNSCSEKNCSQTAGCMINEDNNPLCFCNNGYELDVNNSCRGRNTIYGLYSNKSSLYIFNIKFRIFVWYHIHVLAENKSDQQVLLRYVCMFLKMYPMKMMHDLDLKRNCWQIEIIPQDIFAYLQTHFQI